MTWLYKPNKIRAAQIRTDLKARGVRANVRFFNQSYRIVLPAYTPEGAETIRLYMLETGLSLAGYNRPEGKDWLYSWSTFEGRGQIFAYDYRK